MRPPNTQEAGRLYERHYTMLFGVRRSVRYHNYRYQFYIGVQSLSSLIILLLGSASVANLFEIESLRFLGGGFTKVAPVGITVLAALSLVYRLSEKAALHSNLYRRFVALEIEFLKHEAWTDKIIDELEAKRLEIEMDEPATYQALNRHCYNELVRSEGRPQYMKELKFYHRWLKSLCRFDNLPVDKSDQALTPA